MSDVNVIKTFQNDGCRSFLILCSLVLYAHDKIRVKLMNTVVEHLGVFPTFSRLIF